MAAGRRLIRLDKELEGRREGEGPVKQSEGRKGRSGAVWCTHARAHTCMHTYDAGMHACVLLHRHTWKQCAYIQCGNTLTHRLDQVDESCYFFPL